MFKKSTPLIISSALAALFASSSTVAAPLSQIMLTPAGLPQIGLNRGQGMSRSGRYVIFNDSSNINFNKFTYLRDIKTQTTQLLTIQLNSDSGHALSPNGRYLAYRRATDSVVRDQVTGIETVIQAKRNESIGLSNNGYVLFIKEVATGNQLTRLNLSNKQEQFIIGGDVTIHDTDGSPLGSFDSRNPLSANGEVAIFKSQGVYKTYNASTQQITVLDLPTVNGMVITGPDLSSSGKFVSFKPLNTLNNASTSSVISRLNLESPASKNTFDLTSKNILITDGSATSISMDGRYISFRGRVLRGHPDWAIADAWALAHGKASDTINQGYPRIFRYDTLVDSLLTISTTLNGDPLFDTNSADGFNLWPMVNFSNIISDDGSMVEYSTSATNIVSTPISIGSETNYHVFAGNGLNRNYQFVDMPNSDINFLPFAPMSLVGNNLWEGTITFDGVGTESFRFDVGGRLVNGKFEASPNGAIKFGAGSTQNVAASNGANIVVNAGAGNYKVTFNDQTLAYSITKELPAADWKRTVVFIEGQTQTGQNMFIRGGLDHAKAKALLGRDCDVNNALCSMPIRHLNLRNATTAPWKLGDTLLNWQATEVGQGAGAQGSPLDWTINFWPSSFGTKRTVAVDGFGETPLNLWGAHYWMFEVEMDCSKTMNGWFELKSFISNGPGWEANVLQPGAPYISGNHFAQCGKLNVFKRGQNNPVTIGNF